MAVDPRTVTASTSRRKRMRANARVAQGYERHPPACINCSRFLPAEEAVVGRRPYKQSMCGLGHFPVATGGICDKWRGKNGDTLE